MVALVGLALESSLATSHYSLVTASQLPSLFRGVVVTNSPLGVRVVSVEETSQAYLADLRPEDVIVRVDDHDIHSIDEFAMVSNVLKGQMVRAAVLVFRNGEPRELSIHLYSYPVLREWGLEFMPDPDIRFAQAEVGLAYWTRLGRGFEQAGKPAESLNAYLNGLHNVPTDVATALKTSELFSQLSQASLAKGALADGVASLRQALTITEHLFDYPLTDEQLQTIKVRLTETLEALRRLTRSSSPLNDARPSNISW